MSNVYNMFLGNYTYQILALLFIIAIIFIFYPPTYFSHLFKNNDENFTAKDNPGASTIDSIAEKYATALANETYIKVIDPCSRMDNPNECIGNYKGYFNEILKDQVVDIYTNLKMLNGEYVDIITELQTPEQIQFGKNIGIAFSKSLIAVLKHINDSYETKVKYDRDIFVPLFKQFLKISLYDALGQTFGIYSTPKKSLYHNNLHREKLSSLNWQDRQAFLKTHKQKQQKYNISCEDLRNNVIQLMIDNERITC